MKDVHNIVQSPCFLPWIINDDICMLFYSLFNLGKSVKCLEIPEGSAVPVFLPWIIIDDIYILFYLLFILWKSVKCLEIPEGSAVPVFLVVNYHWWYFHDVLLVIYFLDYLKMFRNTWRKCSLRVSYRELSSMIFAFCSTRYLSYENL
jgi:hypothetical protein